MLQEKVVLAMQYVQMYARLAKVNMMGNNVVGTNDFLCDILVQSSQKRAIPGVNQPSDFSRHRRRPFVRSV